MTFRRPAVILLAVAIDLAAGEPSTRWHPVAWLGRAFHWTERRAPGRSVADGAAALTLVTASAWIVARWLGAVTRRLGWMGVVLEALALKPAFAVRGLVEATDGVEAALRAGDLAIARLRVGRDLVSRPTGDLGADEVASAAIESAAENLVDSVAAPVLAYAAAGLPAAWAYRAVNTADAMWGYRDARYERFGKAAARLDDLVNLVPARLGAAALAAGAALAGEDGAGAARVARAQHRRTASPNAGWPMAAMAGALGVGLAKRGAYRLGESALPSSPDAIRRASRVLGAAATITVVLVAGIAFLGGELEHEAGGVGVNRGLWAGLALSVLAHGGAVAAVGVLGAAWLMGPRPASSPPALYVDLVHPVVATSDRPETLDTSGSRLPTERPRMGVALTAPRAMPGAPLDGAPSPGTTGLAPVPTRPPVPRAVEAPGTASAAIEAPRPPAAPPMPGLANVPAESTPSSAPATERPLPLPRMAAASPPLPSPPAPPSTDPGPRGPAVEAGTSVPRSVTPVPSTRSPSSDPEGRRQAAPESSAAGSSASPGPGTAEPADAASRGWSTRGDGAGPARGGRPGAVDGANLVRLSPGEGQAGSTAGGAIPPEYEAYVRALRRRVQDRLVYPWMAVRRGQQGVVELEVHLAADGRLLAVEVVAGVSADTLRGAAMAAVRGSAPFPFPPGLTPRPLVVRLPVEFRLR